VPANNLGIIKLFKIILSLVFIFLHPNSRWVRQCGTGQYRRGPRILYKKLICT